MSALCGSGGSRQLIEGSQGQGADPTDEDASSLRVDHTGTQAQGDGVGS